MIEYDFVVVGSGAGGLSAALKAARHGRVAVVTKREVEDSNSSWAQGGIACVQSEEDSFDQHVQDTLIAGAGLCKEDAVRVIVKEGPARIDELVAMGVEFDRREEPGAHLEFDLTREGGHTRRRVLHHHDATGKEVTDKLIRAARAEKNITLLEHHYAIDLITTAKLGGVAEDRVLGLYVLDEVSGEVLTLRSDRVILATGGCGRVYLYTTNPKVATGDGVAMAWRAGAAIANMEFIQFHPTCLYHPKQRSYLITEAMRGEGAVLVDGNGEEFMQKYDPRGSLAPRDIVARAIDHEIKRTGAPCVYLDITSKPADFVIKHFPNIYQTCLAVGIDITREPIPVVPAAHYQCGGVRTDVNGATSLRGLCAVGEVGCTGLHGANRLASNSLLECVVVAHRAVELLLLKFPMGKTNGQEYAIPVWQSGDAQNIDELVVIYHNWDEIRRLMWDYVSIVRTRKRLQRAAARLRNLKREVQEFYWNFRISSEVLELRNLVETASLIVDCAERRHESRGLHYTLDSPLPDDSRAPVDTVLRRY
ncbi:L-aspartate oxidase [Phragmitibacter flavus]|uniref:L-aspartate oxidase n=1 Tax=Phragmitibacter flavus TaxID=2576071 RepID=A0A5R8KI33_9BACT|nr:L-aspartate oxidase [Phragmitibacter flavus]TLD71983.1 L-aspartate oxidase [Phragmitibacter flavus]